MVILPGVDVGKLETLGPCVHATLDANQVSTYTLMHKVLPLMKKQGSGYVLDGPSYFGGEKYLAVSHPNRSDDAGSKSGHRAMVEVMMRFLNPRVQIIAVAPSPVESERLKGTGGPSGCRCCTWARCRTRPRRRWPPSIFWPTAPTAARLSCPAAG